jgi:hypothetical protein
VLTWVCTKKPVVAYYAVSYYRESVSLDLLAALLNVLQWSKLKKMLMSVIQEPLTWHTTLQVARRIMNPQMFFFYFVKSH